MAGKWSYTDRIYDTYGNLLSKTGSTLAIFLYNGRDGVITDTNGLVYYYSPELKRFVNADIIAGSISNAITLNRYAYANGNPVTIIDPLGMSAERGNSPYGSVEYGGVRYPIYVPNSSEIAFATHWDTVDEIYSQGYHFDGMSFVAGLKFDDMDGYANGFNGSVLTNHDKL